MVDSMSLLMKFVIMIVSEILNVVLKLNGVM